MTQLLAHTSIGPLTDNHHIRLPTQAAGGAQSTDGSVVVDFNEAYNPPCSFNSFTTCPLPLPENRLAIRILAGEMAYAGGHQ